MESVSSTRDIFVLSPDNTRKPSKSVSLYKPFILTILQINGSVEHER